MTMVAISGALDARKVHRYPRVILQQPVFGPQPPQFAREQFEKRLKKKYEELMEYLEKVKKCFKDQTCAAKILKQASSAATMLAMLVVFAYVGKRAVEGSLQEEMPGRAVLPMVQPVAVSEKRVPELREELIYEPSWKEAEKVADAIPEQSRIVIGDKRRAAQDVFDFVKNKITANQVNYIAFLIPKYAQDQGIDNIGTIKVDGYSLIGAVLQSRLSDANKSEVIRYFLSYGIDIEPTEKDLELSGRLGIEFDY